MFVPVPAARQIARRKNHARAAAEINSFQAGRLGKGRAVALLVRQVAQLVIARVDRLLRQHFAQRPAGENQVDLAPKRFGKILPTAAGVADDRPAVHDVPGEPLADVVAQLELIVTGEKQHRQLAGIVGKMGEVDVDRPVVDSQFLGRPLQQRDHVGRVGRPVAVLHPLAVLGDPAGVAQGRLADQRGRSGRAFLLAPPQSRRRQRQGRRRLAARLVLRLGRRRRTAVDRAAIAFVGPRQSRQAKAAGSPAYRRRKPKPFNKSPPRKFVHVRGAAGFHGSSFPWYCSVWDRAVTHCAEQGPRSQDNNPLQESQRTSLKMGSVISKTPLLCSFA